MLTALERGGTTSATSEQGGTNVVEPAAFDVQSSRSSQIALTWCWMPPTRRGVNARDTSVRSAVCPGGSRKIIIPVAARSWPIRSSTVPRAELNVTPSFCAFSIS
jgi:hypothetical protein